MNQISSFGSSLARRQLFPGSKNSAAELCAMIQELARTARQLQETESARQGPTGFDAQSLYTEADERMAAKVRQLLMDRERRKKIFPAELFADPAWDILLSLFASHLEQRRETITGIICLSGVPATTGLRWVHKLVDEGLLILRDDPLDLRRKWVLLSPTALAALTAYFNPAP